jgi:hypothetical protein
LLSFFLFAGRESFQHIGEPVKGVDPKRFAGVQEAVEDDCTLRSIMKSAVQTVSPAYLM